MNTTDSRLAILRKTGDADVQWLIDVLDGATSTNTALWKAIREVEMCPMSSESYYHAEMREIVNATKPTEAYFSKGDSDGA